MINYIIKANKEAEVQHQSWISAFYIPRIIEETTQTAATRDNVQSCC